MTKQEKLERLYKDLGELVDKASEPIEQPDLKLIINGIQIDIDGDDMVDGVRVVRVDDVYESLNFAAALDSARSSED